jgi:hypothetical protein
LESSAQIWCFSVLFVPGANEFCWSLLGFTAQPEVSAARSACLGFSSSVKGLRMSGLVGNASV